MLAFLLPSSAFLFGAVSRLAELFHELVYDGINVDVIHADRTKLQVCVCVSVTRIILLSDHNTL